MKKGFTMIELIFVIVILGILASVAIPKLNATRDDAEQAKFATNVSTIMGDFASYYTAKGTFPAESGTNFAAVTNVPLNSGVMNIKGKPCLKFEFAGGGKIKVTGEAGGDALCSTLLSSNTGIQALLTGAYTCRAKTGEAIGTDANSPKEDVVGCSKKDDVVVTSVKKAGDTATFNFAASGVVFN